jgi:uncharacterized membrane protein
LIFKKKIVFVFPKSLVIFFRNVVKAFFYHQNIVTNIFLFVIRDRRHTTHHRNSSTICYYTLQSVMFIVTTIHRFKMLLDSLGDTHTVMNSMNYQER